MDNKPKNELELTSDRPVSGSGFIAACPKCVDEQREFPDALTVHSEGFVSCEYHGAISVREVCNRIFEQEKAETRSHSDQQELSEVQCALNIGGTS